jgi:O-antigen ligase
VDRLANWLLAATVFLAPWGSVGVIELISGESPGFGVQPAMLGLLGLLLVVAIQAVGDRRLRETEILALVALFWMIVATTVAWTVDVVGLAGDRPWTKSVKQLIQWTFFVLAALAVARRLERDIPAIIDRALGIGLIVACLVAILAAAVGPGVLPVLDTNSSIASGSDELYLGHSFTGISRLRAPMPEPLMFGSYLLAAVPLVGLAACARRGWSRWWRLGAALLGAACLLATWSRGAWLGAAASVALLGVAWMRGRFGTVSRSRVALGAGVAIAAGVAGLAFVLQVAPWELPGLLFDRLVQSAAGHDMSNMTRVWAWRAAGEMFVDAPFVGHGWGTYGFLFFDYAPASASSAHFGWPVPNNLALLLLAETGLIGLSLWVAMLWPALVPLVDRSRNVVTFVVACAIAGLLLQFATFSQWNLPHVWLLLGAGLGLARHGIRGVPCVF